jgi:hypothetical protein
MIYCLERSFHFIVYAKDLARRQGMFNPLCAGVAIGRSPVIFKLIKSTFFHLKINLQKHLQSPITSHELTPTNCFVTWY